MYTKRTMYFRVKHILLILVLSSALLGCVTSEREISQKIRTAPHKNIGNNVIDGTGTENTFSLDGTNIGLGERSFIYFGNGCCNRFRCSAVLLCGT